MEWFKEITQFIVNLSWPITVFIIVLLFRKIITSIIVEIPGGSKITVGINDLEKKILDQTKLKEINISDIPLKSSQIKFTDPQLAIAQIRIDIEKELFRLSWIVLDHDNIKGWSIERYIDELLNEKILETDFSINLRNFIRISNSIIHGTRITEKDKIRFNSIGISLVAQLHYKRKVIEMERDFDGHGLWHMHKHLSEDSRKYYFYSAVAASLPEFDYNYNIYREAAERYNNKIERRESLEYRKYFSIYILSLDEFVKVLEFREKELLRLINTWHSHNNPWEAFEKGNYWQWPEEWGNLGWKGPIIRERLSLYTAEDDLMQIRIALNRYRTQLLSK